MLGLTLRKEFQGRRLKGTAIELANEKNTGATQVPASEFLEITYPSSDLLKAVEAVGPNQWRSHTTIASSQIRARGQPPSRRRPSRHPALATETERRQGSPRPSSPPTSNAALCRVQPPAEEYQRKSAQHSQQEYQRASPGV